VSYFNNKKNKKLGLFVSIIIICLITGFSLLLMSLRADKIKESVTIEAGDAIPDVEAFFIKNKTVGRYITDISIIDTKKIGAKEIELEADGKIYTSLLIIEDTIPPIGKPVERYVFNTAKLGADDFVTDIEDMTQVTCSFLSPPDLSRKGWQRIAVALTDEGGNSANINVKIYVFDVVEEIEIEAGITKKFSIKDFTSNYRRASHLPLPANFSRIKPCRLANENLSKQMPETRGRSRSKPRPGRNSTSTARSGI